jgi:hypothetical protein
MTNILFLLIVYQIKKLSDKKSQLKNLSDKKKLADQKNLSDLKNYQIKKISQILDIKPRMSLSNTLYQCSGSYSFHSDLDSGLFSIKNGQKF